MTDHHFVQVTTTVDDRGAAEFLADDAVRARKAACAQVEGPIRSTYWWKGKLETSAEWRVVFKTTAGNFLAFERYLRQRHPYDVPEIIAVPITAGNSDYLAWIAAETESRSASTSSES